MIELLRLDNDNEIKSKNLRNLAKGVKTDIHIKDYIYQPSDNTSSRINTITKHISFLKNKKFS